MLKKMFQNRFINILILGFVSGFSMPPFCIWPILFFGLSYLFVCVMREDKIIKKFLIGYLFGFSFSISSLEWIAHSAFAFCNPDLYIFYPILLLVIPFYLAFFIAVPSAITIILKKFTPIKMGIGFAVLISIFEWIRSFYGLQPFCWNLFSHAFATSIYTLQITSIIGILGLSLFSIILFILPGILFLSSYSKSARLFTYFWLVIFLMINIFGWKRIYSGMETNDKQYVRIIQPNIKMCDKIDPDKKYSHIQKINDLILKPSNHDIKMVIMPETSIPGGIHDGKINPNIKMPDAKYLIAGANVYEGKDMYNSMVVIETKSKEIIMQHNKVHLVAFVERNLFAYGKDGYNSGDGPKTFDLGQGLKFSPVICFDSIFTSKVIDKNNRPKFILKVTNDAWWPKRGSYQHLYTGRIRAIEEGVPIIRAANTGVSCIIDSYGQIVAKINLNATGILDYFIPRHLSPTLYSCYGILCYFFMIFIMCVTLAIRRKK